MWLLSSPIGDYASLDKHLEWLWKTIAPHKSYFAGLIAKAAWCDVCLGCLSESAFPIISTHAEALSIARELNVDVSFNFTCV